MKTLASRLPSEEGILCFDRFRTGRRINVSRAADHPSLLLSHRTQNFSKVECLLHLLSINPVESAAFAEDCPLNFIPSAERFVWVNQLGLLKVIPVFIRD